MLFIVAFLTLFSSQMSVEPTANGSLILLEVELSGVPSNLGNLRIAVYDSPQTFRSNHQMAYRLEVPAKLGKVAVSLKVKPGRYALAVYHDANKNGKLDTNFFGLPTEAYGFSNNARGRFGPPNFAECLVSIMENTSIAIALS